MGLLGGGGSTIYTNQWSIGSNYDAIESNKLSFHFSRTSGIPFNADVLDLYSWGANVAGDISLSGKITNTTTACAIDSFKLSADAESLLFFVNGEKYAAKKP
jgi:hypothetical protein